MNSIDILGIRVDNTDVGEVHEHIRKTVSSNGKALIFNINIYGANIAFKNPAFRAALNGSDLTFCDGAGIRLGAFLLGKSLKPRITYADWMWRLAAFAAAESMSLFLLGGRPGVAKEAGEALRRRYPSLAIAGTGHGFFDKSKFSRQSREVIKKINTAAPDILVVGFGMPTQEFWLVDHWNSINAKVGLSGGAVFDYVSGCVKRGPPILTRTGFEWLARLLIEPHRLWHRYLVGNPLFLWRVLRNGSRAPFTPVVASVAAPQAQTKPIFINNAKQPLSERRVPISR